MRGRKALTAKRKKAIVGYLFISPFLLGILFVFGKAVLDSIIYSFGQTDIQFHVHNVGFSNYYRMLFVEPDFVRDIVESIGSLTANVTVIVLYALFVSNILNRQLKGRGFFRAMLFLPVIIATGIVSKIESLDTVGMIAGAGQTTDSSLLGVHSIEQYLISMNFQTDITNILVSSIQNIYTIISCSGVQIVIFLAGLQTISPALYESARVEGATGWESFWKITMPMISPLILLNTLYTVIDSFTSSDNKVMDRVMGYINESVNYGYAAASAWLYFLVIILFLAILLPIMNRFIFYENK